MEWFDKVVNFLKECAPTELVMLATLFLIPILVVVLLIVSLVKLSRRKSEKDEECAECEIEQVQVAEPENVVASSDAVATPYEPQVKMTVPYDPQAKNAAPERVKVKVRVTNLKKVDKYLLMATGIFGVGLGVMIQRAMGSDK